MSQPSERAHPRRLESCARGMPRWARAGSFVLATFVVLVACAPEARAQATGGSFGGGSFGGSSSSGTSPERSSGRERSGVRPPPVELPERRSAEDAFDDQLALERHALAGRPAEERARSALFVTTLVEPPSRPRGPVAPEQVAFYERELEDAPTEVVEPLQPRPPVEEPSLPFALAVAAFVLLVGVSIAWRMRPRKTEEVP